MKKLLLLLGLFPFFWMSCNQTGNQKDTSEIVQLSIEDFMNHAADYTGKVVTLEGTVSHVCHRTGKRLFIHNGNEDDIVRVESSEAIPQFDQALEGARVKITGIVKEFRMDEEYLSQWEQDVLEQTETGDNCKEGMELAEKKGEENCKEDTSTPEDTLQAETTQQEDQGLNEELKKIQEFRKKLAESDKGYIVLYHYIECQSVEEISPENTEE